MEKSNQFNFVIPKWEELPDIELYLDQVVTYIDKYLSQYIKNDFNTKNEKDEKENKLLTKTMINNYVKQKIIEAPVKKKYNKTNVAYLIVICILKQVYSISDIDNLIKIALSNAPIEKAYNSFCKALENSIDFTFNNKKILDTPTPTTDQYILFNVAQTFASKLYVEKKLLEKNKRDI